MQHQTDFTFEMGLGSYTILTKSCIGPKTIFRKAFKNMFPKHPFNK